MDWIRGSLQRNKYNLGEKRIELPQKVQNKSKDGCRNKVPHITP